MQVWPSCASTFPSLLPPRFVVEPNNGGNPSLRFWHSWYVANWRTSGRPGISTKSSDVCVRRPLPAPKSSPLKHGTSCNSQRASSYLSAASTWRMVGSGRVPSRAPSRALSIVRSWAQLTCPLTFNPSGRGTVKGYTCGRGAELMAATTVYLPERLPRSF